MEIVDFYPKVFYEIPMQDNPAYGTNACYMIVKDIRTLKPLVLKIIPDPIESVIHIATFWEHKDAVEYCELKVNKKS